MDAPLTPRQNSDIRNPVRNSFARNFINNPLTATSSREGTATLFARTSSYSGVAAATPSFAGGPVFEREGRQHEIRNSCRSVAQQCGDAWGHNMLRLADSGHYDAIEERVSADRAAFEDPEAMGNFYASTVVYVIFRQS